MLRGGQNGFSELLEYSYTLCVGQNGLSEFPNLLHALLWSKRTIQTTTSLLHTLRWMKGLSELLQASCTLCGGQNSFSELNYTMVILREGHRTIRNITLLRRWNEQRYTLGVTSLSAKWSAQRPVSPVGEGIEQRRLLLLHSKISPEKRCVPIRTGQVPFTLSGRLSPTSLPVLCELTATKLFYCLAGCLGHDYYEHYSYTSWLSKHPLT